MKVTQQSQEVNQIFVFSRNLTPSHHRDSISLRFSFPVTRVRRLVSPKPGGNSWSPHVEKAWHSQHQEPRISGHGCDIERQDSTFWASRVVSGSGDRKKGSRWGVLVAGGLHRAISERSPLDGRFHRFSHHHQERSRILWLHPFAGVSVVLPTRLRRYLSGPQSHSVRAKPR